MLEDGDGSLGSRFMPPPTEKPPETLLARK
jgi:hypothetical protein